MRHRRLFDAATAEKLWTLHTHAQEHGLYVNMDFCSRREPSLAWIVQIFDDEDRTLVTARATSLDLAVADLHERWLSRNVNSGGARYRFDDE